MIINPSRVSSEILSSNFSNQRKRRVCACLLNILQRIREINMHSRISDRSDIYNTYTALYLSSYFYVTWESLIILANFSHVPSPAELNATNIENRSLRWMYDYFKLRACFVWPKRYKNACSPDGISLLWVINSLIAKLSLLTIRYSRFERYYNAISYATHTFSTRVTRNPHVPSIVTSIARQ